MPRLPTVCARDAIRAFSAAGFVHVRTSGSHVYMKKEGHVTPVVIPSHAGTDLKPGLLRSQIRNAGLTVEQFLEFLK
ncbi:MAG: type II toxin-antitoxin system HicA family toxin [Pirellulales bacterium]|nr:type II toxin-antitoxin system HicA family toxin [Pirellulales bacterium]